MNCKDCEKYKVLEDECLAKNNSPYDIVLDMQNAIKNCRKRCKMQIIDGKKIALDIKNKVKEKILNKNYKLTLAVIQVGNDPASSTYVKNKRLACEYCGINCTDSHYPDSISEDELIQEIMLLNRDPAITGILVQLPLPSYINAEKVLGAIDPLKDVDGFTDKNTGRLNKSNKSFYIAPCTPTGVVEMLWAINEPLTGKSAVIIGRSNIVGKPLAALLLQENMNVIVLHSKTSQDDIEFYCRHADVIVVATGHENTLTDRHFYGGKNPIIIDVGIHRGEDGKLHGDVSEEIKVKYSSYYTPVPGGVGPMTVAMLMYNINKADDFQKGKL